MLETVDVGTQSVDRYAHDAGAAAVEELRELAKPLQGLRVLHVSATPYGGGVAEILRSEIPLLRDLGLAADWHLISGDERVLRGDQGHPQRSPGVADRASRPADEQRYLAQSSTTPRMLDDERYDIVVVHDPQPLALLELHGRGDSRWIWRCHIDTARSEPRGLGASSGRSSEATTPRCSRSAGSCPPTSRRAGRDHPAGHRSAEPEEPRARHGARDRVLELDRRRHSAAAHHPGLPVRSVEGPPRRRSRRTGSRGEVPDLQLALVGSMALDDPGGWDVYHQILAEVRSDPDIHVFTNLTGVGNVEVNAFQRLSQVVIQKSIREGFGLVVSESLWKGTPVVAGRAGGIPLQLQDGGGGFLVESVEECAERMLELLGDPQARRELGESAARSSASASCSPASSPTSCACTARWSAPSAASRRARSSGSAPNSRDPVCGMHVNHFHPRHLEYDHETYYFCSRTCEEEFAANPERFLRATSRLLPHRDRPHRWFHRGQ